MFGFPDIFRNDIAEIVRQQPCLVVENYEENGIGDCGEDCVPLEISSDLCWKLININPGTYGELVFRPGKGLLILAPLLLKYFLSDESKTSANPYWLNLSILFSDLITFIAPELDIEKYIINAWNIKHIFFGVNKTLKHVFDCPQDRLFTKGLSVQWLNMAFVDFTLFLL